MTDTTLATVLVSALTSGVVSLGLEWLVKPRLEARKVVRLDLFRKRHMFRSSMLAISTDIGRWSEFEEPEGLPEPVRRRLNDDRRRAIRRIDDAINAMNDDINDIALSHLGARIQRLIAGYITAIYFVNLSGSSRIEKWEIIRKLTELAYDWRFERFWKFRKRTKAMFNLIRELEKYAKSGA